jgi:regulatory protein
LRITAIVAHPRREGRYRLEVDGRDVAVIDAEVVQAARLRIGAEYTESTDAAVRLGAARVAAFDAALGALARRSRSERELERWLVQRDHSRENVARALERLMSLGLLNDAEFARSFVRNRALSRGMSRRRIQAELARRGVARELIDGAITDVMTDESVDERALVAAAAEKKLRSLQKLAPDVRRRRLYGYLARRGYAADLVREIVNRGA